jgi:hypothetical protein
MTGDPPADHIDASLEEFRALNARLIRRIAKLRAAVETVRDATACGDFMRDFCQLFKKGPLCPESPKTKPPTKLWTAPCKSFPNWLACFQMLTDS